MEQKKKEKKRSWLSQNFHQEILHYLPLVWCILLYPDAITLSSTPLTGKAQFLPLFLNIFRYWYSEWRLTFQWHESPGHSSAISLLHPDWPLPQPASSLIPYRFGRLDLVSSGKLVDQWDSFGQPTKRKISVQRPLTQPPPSAMVQMTEIVFFCYARWTCTNPTIWYLNQKLKDFSLRGSEVPTRSTFSNTLASFTCRNW